MFRSWWHFLKVMAIVISFDIISVLVGIGIYKLIF